LGVAFHSFRNENEAQALNHASATPAEIVEAIGHCRLRLQFVREQQTTNLGVRSSNLFGRATFLQFPRDSPAAAQVSATEKAITTVKLLFMPSLKRSRIGASALKEVHRNNNSDYSRENHPIEHCCNSIRTRSSLCFQSGKIGPLARTKF